MLLSGCERAFGVALSCIINTYQHMSSVDKYFLLGMIEALKEEQGMTSKTQQAIADHLSGMTVSQAARKHEISPAAIYEGLKRLTKKKAKESGMEPCPCCGTVVPVEKIDRSVLQ
jgi:hypothetical protein